MNQETDRYCYSLEAEGGGDIVCSVTKDQCWRADSLSDLLRFQGFDKSRDFMLEIWLGAETPCPSSHSEHLSEHLFYYHHHPCCVVMHIGKVPGFL